MKEKRTVILASAFVLLVLLGTVGLFYLSRKNRNTNNDTIIQSNEASTSTNEFLLAGYPLQEVPLIKLKKVNSSKFFTNSNPNNTSPFDESPFSYFNVVFETEATQAEFLEYYRSLFDTEIKDEFPSDTTVKGKIGEYKVTASHYGNDNTGYLQIHVSDATPNDIDHFKNLPTTITNLLYLVEHEKSYGLLNQKGGEIEYTQYYSILNTGDKDKDGIDDTNEIQELEYRLMNEFDRKEAYNFEAKSKTFTFNEHDFAKTVVLSEDHKRIYIMMRKGIK